MTTDVPLVLWLFVVNLGVVFGAGVYEQSVVAPGWLIRQSGQPPRWDAAAARRDDVGRRFWVLAATLPFTILTVTSVVLAWPATSRLLAFELSRSIARTVRTAGAAGSPT